MQVKNINLNRLIGGLEQIGQLDITDIKLNYAIGKNLNKLTIPRNSYNKSLGALVNKHVQMDDKGTPVTIGNEYDFKTKKDRDAYIKSKTEIDEGETEVDLWKLKTSVLEKVMKRIKCDKCGAEKEVSGLNGVMFYMLVDIIVDDINILGDGIETDNKKTSQHVEENNS